MSSSYNNTSIMGFGREFDQWPKAMRQTPAVQHEFFYTLSVTLTTYVAFLSKINCYSLLWVVGCGSKGVDSGVCLLVLMWDREIYVCKVYVQVGFPAKFRFATISRNGSETNILISRNKKPISRYFVFRDTVIFTK